MFKGQHLLAAAGKGTFNVEIGNAILPCNEESPFSSALKYKETQPDKGDLQ